jgi:uncharacterized protein (DUF1778 family)
MDSDIKTWILEKLSVSLPNFNNMPACPFAKQALLDEKILILELESKNEFLPTMNHYSFNWPENIEVIVLGCNPSLITADELTAATEQANSTFLKDQYLALEDHPYSLEYVTDYCVNEGNWALILLQSKEKIEKARKILEKKGYYKNWDDEYYKEVVLNRS